MAEIRHLENRHDVIFLCWEWSDLNKISQTGAEWHVDCGDMLEVETRCRIPIWRTFGRIQWHVIPATYHIAGCCHLVNSLSWFQSHMPRYRVQSPGEINIMIVPHCRCKNSIRHIENRFSPYFFLFLMQFRLWRAAAFVSSPIHLFDLQLICYFFFVLRK